MAFSWNPFKGAQREAAPIPLVHDSTRPGTGSDPAPYVPTDQWGYAAGHEPIRQQWTRFGRGYIDAFRSGAPEQIELVQTLANTNQITGAEITPDDGHEEFHVVDDPYVVNPPQPKRHTSRMVPSYSFRETAASVQKFGGFSNTMDGNHFSMATNIRTYPIGGQQPVVRRRNTYRLTPPPIDINDVDLPASGTSFNVADKTTIAPVYSGALRSVKMLRS